MLRDLFYCQIITVQPDIRILTNIAARNVCIYYTLPFNLKIDVSLLKERSRCAPTYPDNWHFAARTRPGNHLHRRNKRVPSISLCERKRIAGIMREFSLNKNAGETLNDRGITGGTACSRATCRLK